MSDMNQSPRLNPTSGPGLGFLSEDEILEIRGVSTYEDASIRSRLGERLKPGLDFFVVSGAIPVEEGNIDFGQIERGPILERLARQIATSGMIPTPALVCHLAGRVFFVWLFEPAKSEAVDLLRCRSLLAGKISQAFDAISKEIDSGKAAPPPTFH
jgi:hypothetical protein